MSDEDLRMPVPVVQVYSGKGLASAIQFVKEHDEQPNITIRLKFDDKGHPVFSAALCDFGHTEDGTGDGHYDPEEHRVPVMFMLGSVLASIAVRSPETAKEDMDELLDVLGGMVLTERRMFDVDGNSTDEDFASGDAEEEPKTCANDSENCDIDLAECDGCGAGPTHCVCRPRTVCATHAEKE